MWFCLVCTYLLTPSRQQSTWLPVTLPYLSKLQWKHRLALVVVFCTTNFSTTIQIKNTNFKIEHVSYRNINWLMLMLHIVISQNWSKMTLVAFYSHMRDWFFHLLAQVLQLKILAILVVKSAYFLSVSLFCGTVCYSVIFHWYCYHLHVLYLQCSCHDVWHYRFCGLSINVVCFYQFVVCLISVFLLIFVGIWAVSNDWSQYYM